MAKSDFEVLQCALGGFTLDNNCRGADSPSKFPCIQL